MRKQYKDVGGLAWNKRYLAKAGLALMLRRTALLVRKSVGPHGFAFRSVANPLERT
jgi:hypothetical protein